MKQGGYGGRTRYILKDALKFVPLYGWCLGEVRWGGGEGRGGGGVGGIERYGLCITVLMFPQWSSSYPPTIHIH